MAVGSTLGELGLSAPPSVVVLSLAGALFYALASALQHQAASDQPGELSVHAGLLFRLMHEPRWLLGNGADAAGYLCQFLALRRGSQALVQPLLLSGLVFALPAGAILEHRRLSRPDWLGALIVVLGISGFLVAARPGPGHPQASLAGWVVVSVLVGLITGAAVVVARRSPRHRAILLGLGAGVLYGYTSALAERTGRLFDQGVFAVLTSWTPYVLVVAGVVGMLLAQSAFQAGDLRFSLPVLTVAEPLVAIAMGRFLFGEHLAAHGLSPLVEALSLVVMTAGVFLAARSPEGHPEEPARPMAPSGEGDAGATVAREP
ncbi:MAG TPA: DMT family transporter [Acidimicrobiales bacterium]|nr:DMT family transporter [Acidimicrobiales bacterium]